ncbi:MAG: phosphoribosylamine--glycine ligase [Actinobacteria bacterium]|nr:phosphoribosylamine--glycine ligase [Actinomycetota bacterium]MBV9662468.1 phosphoribosylamine--glycine ligase [Actinomycetota bacterium]MBV9935916.1 phosphoribosylamine--glycine ligase [Actinomycetota bacterium]
MRVVVVGGGGREHALAHVLSRTADVVATPGNPGIANSVATPPEELDADLFVVGPEAPLVDGLADRLRAQGKRVFGPGADGAALEGSKAWMKQVVSEAGVPTAQHGTFDDADAAAGFLRSLAPPYVVKTDGLAAGKGVLVTETLADAIDDVRAKLSGASFGEAGRRVVVEEGMRGPELSVLAVCDGTDAVLLPSAQDFKRAFDGDTGPNTGGMGAYSPVPGVDLEQLDILGRFIEPTLLALRKRDIDYRGVLYAGLMFTEAGPKLLEFNVRFGDPEAQVVLPRLDGDLAALLASAADGGVSSPPGVRPGAAVTVVIGGDAPAGTAIEGVEAASAVDGVTVFHARTAVDGDGRLVTSGSGRVLAVTGEGGSVEAAREIAYQAVSHIAWPGMQYRRDIAKGVE